MAKFVQVKKVFQAMVAVAVATMKFRQSWSWLRISCSNFIEPLTASLAPSSDLHLNLFNTLVYDRTPAELQRITSVSPGLDAS